MSLDMLDAIFMARRGVLRAQRTPYDAQFAVVPLLPPQRPTNTVQAANNGERVAPAAPSTALSWARGIPLTTPKTNPGSTGAQRTTVADAGRRPRRAVSPRKGSAP